MRVLAIDGLASTVWKPGYRTETRTPIRIPPKLQKFHRPIQNVCSNNEIQCFMEAPDFFVCRILSLCYGLRAEVFVGESWQPYLAKYP